MGEETLDGVQPFRRPLPVHCRLDRLRQDARFCPTRPDRVQVLACRGHTLAAHPEQTHAEWPFHSAPPRMTSYASTLRSLTMMKKPASRLLRTGSPTTTPKAMTSALKT